ncbi:SUF system Fe-S cluster assembly regulator [Peristeroidobacter agariperforans]|uniref:SUF system Fe-S cluster assembly regulator n=1 Tax=Peristeroidobacter agariperforans TaxID=268404 RepID=UPI00101CCFDD|nr:SUF system Fe-S cluster assembly regulator [Peristeroidobacter agariperforans]
MLRISKLTDYGTVILARLAGQPDRLWTATEVAEATHIGLPTVSKLLKKLQRSGLVVSTRGSHGGYQLAQAPGEITAARILDALEGPFAITECSGSHSTCGLESKCSVGHTWQKVNAAIRRALTDISLAELAGTTHGVTTTTVPLTRLLRASHD